MDIVTFETAKRLKDAGFPQPEPERGQAWYFDSNEEDLPGVVVDVAERRFMLVFGGTDPVEVRKSDRDHWLFAPTATDIMRQLPGLPLVYDGPNFGISGDWFSNLNPAELMAERYLETK